ncbi:prepilin-type N-terminal cleavage/methylation domain-containing protein [Candidatus Pelagibacter bacterium]|nr:prepilin-type N-terminal cleavage/methylation domain-containing protein [Candidatus Pelagibacter bacterium]
MKKLNVKKGFSLIELLVVIAIIGVLSAVGITAYTGYTASAKEQAARTQFSQTVSMINAEMAKCALGSGDFAWPAGATKDTCAAGIDAATDTNIASYLTASNGLGYKNPYAQDEAAATFTKAVADATTNPDADGRITIFCAASGDCTVKQDVGDEILAQTIASAS